MAQDYNNTQLMTYVHPFEYSLSSYTPIMESIGEASLILMGQATHGTLEFYQIRSILSKKLIQEKGFKAIAIEADWPDAYILNLYVKNLDPSLDESKALEAFERFPSWMWCNEEMLDFIRWLRSYNDQFHTSHEKVGIFGLDLYSLHASMKLVIQHLEKIDVKMAEAARERYECLQQHSDDPTRYSYAVTTGLAPDCKDEVYDQLIDIMRLEIKTLEKPDINQEELLFLTQNAKIVANAEAYYRSLFKGPEITWNLRAKHMMETLESLRIFHQRIHNCPPKTLVWAHNIHVGDARATHLFYRNEISMGQLARTHYGNNCYLLGFTTYEGYVTAASTWGGGTERKKLPPAMEGSYEHLFHHLNISKFFISLHQEMPLMQPLLHRSIGIIYKPDIEPVSHYHYSYLAQQFDGLIHVDKTNAVQPLKESHYWHKGEFPETFPSGI